MQANQDITYIFHRKGIGGISKPNVMKESDFKLLHWISIIWCESRAKANCQLSSSSHRKADARMDDCTKVNKFSEFTKGNADRISGLPDEVIHLVYSFLDMKEVLGMTLLSKRWRYVWCSAPTLNFDERMWHVFDKRESIWAERERSDEFVDRALLCRGSSDTVIQKLSLSSYCGLGRKTHTWINSAMKQHLQELHLENMIIPISFFGDIKSLTIKNCTYPDEGFTICAPELKFLMVVNVDIRRKQNYFTLSAPNLSTLYLRGYMFIDYNIKYLSGLVTADIDILFAEVLNKSPEATSHMVAGLRNVEYLRLPAHFLKFLPEMSDDLKWRPSVFYNLKYLKLTKWRGCDYAHEREKLVGYFPNLETLVLDRFEIFGGPGKGGRDLRTMSYFDSIFSHLKTIEISRFDGCDNEHNFLVFLLNNAAVLEHVILKVSNPASEKRLNFFLHFCKLLQMMLKASTAPSVTISLMVKREGRFITVFKESSSSSDNLHPMLDY